ncbi:MAG: hypothetical protein WBA76_00330 [Phormidesmis sp.]
MALSQYLSYRRTEAVKAFAHGLGFAYREYPRQHINSAIWQSDLCSRGRDRTLKNLVQGEINATSFSVADYSYVTGHGKGKRTHCQTIALVECHQRYLPRFRLMPENLFHKIGGVFGRQDIDFDTHPDFSNQYLLQGYDEAEIRGCFNPSVLEFFQSHQRFCVESMGSVLLYYNHNYSLSPKEWRKIINSACRVYSQF